VANKSGAQRSIESKMREHRRAAEKREKMALREARRVARRAQSGVILGDGQITPTKVGA
jgi:hypothetical protein